MKIKQRYNLPTLKWVYIKTLYPPPKKKKIVNKYHLNIHAQIYNKYKMYKLTKSSKMACTSQIYIIIIILKMTSYTANVEYQLFNYLLQKKLNFKNVPNIP